ncbi:helix-turn-helix domain-containing protein [Auraticoccus sp. F435]|uniref:Helix-turn-helix domain-containing protein n=1 Tax=Auraticoccus cholistanensis TaxID=2656650 RepID=A0A6A9UVU6_9ACTN|nr:helix-turn-helix transcriptional regulator [Auraticoccus cholistanensis]MVA76963.1 helix-turn-helix domain-containing protein [Auraticoccus cholistanensis]
MSTDSVPREALRLVPDPVVPAHATVSTGRTTFEGQHAGDALKHVARTFKVRIRGNCASREVSFRHDRVVAGGLSFDEVTTTATTELTVGSLRHLVLGTLVRGRLRLDAAGVSEEYHAGDSFVLGAPGQDVVLSAQFPTLSLLLVDPSLLPTGGTDLRRLPGRRPISPEAGAAWRDTVAAARSLLLAHDGGGALPSVLRALEHALPVAALGTFTGSVSADAAVPTAGEPVPYTLRHALEILEGAAGDSISVEEVARTVGVTQRALQYTFRRHLDTTPAAYLRRLRLDRVHADLLRADARDGATVAQIAARWGFHHPGQFAALYRSVFGQRPSTTLHADRFDPPAGGMELS